MARLRIRDLNADDDHGVVPSAVGLLGAMNHRIHCAALLPGVMSPGTHRFSQLA
jgi:hypothetical protein